MMKNKSLWILLALVVIVALGLNYTNSHLDDIMAARADYYFKKNDIENAQKYLEKAFELGLNKTKSRDIYVNSIINSPLTTDAQEKLIKFLDNPKDDVARVKVKYFLYDIKREIYRKYPYNYITNAVYNQKIMHWGNLPITYSIEQTEETPKYFEQEIKNAFTEWERATEHQILFEETDKNPNIVIKFNAHNPADSEDKKYVVAYTVPILNLNRLQQMEIEFYLKDSSGKNFSKNQIYNTALHEIVHALGLMGHSNNKDDIMYLTKDSVSVLNDTREDLSEADINTVKLLYKLKPQITNDEELKYDYIPFLVLGNDKEINNEKIKEAKNYIQKASQLPAGYIDLAEGYVVAKDYKRAIKSLEKALQLADTEEIKGMVYFNLAVTNFYVDNLEKAHEHLLYSMKIKDTDEKRYLLGEIYVREGHSEKAIPEYKNLIAKNPKNIEYTIALTNIYIINHEYLKARSVLKNYIKNNPAERNNPRLKPYGILKKSL